MADENKPDRAKTEGYGIAYINASIMGFSPWDIQFTLSMSSGAGADVVREEVITVVQSPTHAKAMLRALTKTLAAYEAQFGPIPDIEKPRQDKSATENEQKRQKRSDRRPAPRSAGGSS